MTIIQEKNSEKNGEFIDVITLNGDCQKYLYQSMIKGENWNDLKLQKLFCSSAGVLKNFVTPTIRISTNKFNKVLCLGKVQSGKTAFFISTMALAFDNGYNLCYVIGGTKNNLLSQNKEKVQKEFSNNDNILIADMNSISSGEIREKISCGVKIILMVLKNRSKNSDSNLAKLESLSKELYDIPTLIVDDEGDEYSPGNEKGKNKGAVHNAIVNSIKSIKRGTFLSVTATPQSNLLISTFNSLSPDYCFLINPGEGYTGATIFHDTKENPLVVGVEDSQEFIDSIPDTFKIAIRMFLIGTAIRVIRGDNGVHSMLVHPSALTSVHSMIYDKIKNELKYIKDTLRDCNSLSFDEESEIIKSILRDEYETLYDETLIIDKIIKNLVRTEVFEVNSKSEINDESRKDFEKFNKYRIYVGGGKLERGITLDNLSITYIYRLSKEVAIDTLLQRARWFGYKERYLDLCRVYMPKDMIEMFVEINRHEEYLWKSMANFIASGKSIKLMPRIFKLSNDKLILTRKTISKTVQLKTLHQGYFYDRTVVYNDAKQIQINKQLLDDYFTHKIRHEEILYGRNKEHKHVIFKVPYEDFFEKVLVKMNFPKGCKNITRTTFTQIKELINENIFDSQFFVVLMRYGENEYRSLTEEKNQIKELPQSYDIGTGYQGDKQILGDLLHLQIHNVYSGTDKNDFIPMLAVNNPFIKDKLVDFVTGDNIYEYD